MKKLGLIFISIGLVACATGPDLDDLSPDQKEKLNSMVVSKRSTNRGYVVFGEVRGLSCSQSDHNVKMISEDDAIAEIKLQAVLLDADAVIHTKCEQKGIDREHNCWASMVCVGEAIKYKKRRSN